MGLKIPAMEVIELTLLSPCVSVREYRGSARRARGLKRLAKSPPLSGGASWFVLLAAEKNEQIKRINVTRTFFDRERKSFVSQSSLAVPRVLHRKI